MVQIIPAILATSEKQLEEDLAKIKSASGLKEGWLHLDFADGEFVSNRTIDVNDIKNYPIDLKLEAHLMVTDPGSWLKKFNDLKIARAIAHIECDVDSIDDFISSCQFENIEIGLAIKLETDLEKLEPFWEEADLILVMAIEPGFQGQPFQKEVLGKIKELSEIKKEGGYDFLIAVDGHVTEEDAKVIVEAGAEVLVSGSYLLTGDIDENLEKIWEAIN